MGCVVENLELRKVSGPKRGEVTGHWKISDSELLRDFIVCGSVHLQSLK